MATSCRRGSVGRDIDHDGLIACHDYAPEILGGTPAAHYLSGYSQFDGIMFPTHRKVLPRGSDNRPDPETVLIVIEFAGNYILSCLSAPSLAAAGRGPQEMFRVLRPGGQLFIADFGARQSPSIFRSPRVVAKW